MESFKKLLVIGDIHGRCQELEQALAKAKELEAFPIFIGDLTDSFKRTNAEQLAALIRVADLCEAGQAKCLWGNHDLSYLFPQWFRCSGFSETKRQLFSAGYQKLWKSGNFDPFLSFSFGEKRILITHAGLAPNHVPALAEDPIKFLKEVFTEDLRAIPSHPLLQAGFDSGSWDQMQGGITWLRPSELKDGFSDIIQIVGHTPQRAITFINRLNMWVIDSLEYGLAEVLFIDLEALEIKTISLTS